MPASAANRSSAVRPAALLAAASLVAGCGAAGPSDAAEDPSVAGRPAAAAAVTPAVPAPPSATGPAPAGPATSAVPGTPSSAGSPATTTPSQEGRTAPAPTAPAPGSAGASTAERRADRTTDSDPGPGEEVLASVIASAVDSIAVSVSEVSPALVQQQELSFAVIGDSLTAGGVVISGTEVTGSASWIPAADAVPGLSFVGGWAVPGSTTEEMVAAPVPADAEALVILAGTNDLLRGVPWERSVVALEAIVTAAARPVVAVVAIPPIDHLPDARQAYNAALAGLAVARGWNYVDPWGPIDDGGQFRPGTTTDGVHLPDGVAADVGRRIGEAVGALG